MRRQEALFRLALSERGLPDDDVRIDHENGYCYRNGTRYSIVYPDSFFERSVCLLRGANGKALRYWFQGHRAEGREKMLAPWARIPGVVHWSKFGRDPAYKSEWDADYFARLASAEFGLCPHHPEWPGPRETLWTYRFVDCVLVGAIPLLFWATPLAPSFTDGFRFVWDDDDTHTYHAADAAHNRALAEERFRL